VQRHVGAGDADVPAVGLADRDRLRRALKGTRPPHHDAPDFGEDQVAVIELRTVADLLVGERVEAVAALEAREASLLTPLHAAEEGLVGLIQPRQHVLQHVAVDGGVLGERRPDVLEFRFLLVARDGHVAALIGGNALFEGNIVELAAE
jgi:hypothetical protein